MDTINTHGGSTGCHPQLFDKYVTRLMSERGLDKNGDVDELKKVIGDAERQSCDKYLTCLFIMVADDGRYYTRNLSEPWITSTLRIRVPILRLCRRH